MNEFDELLNEVLHKDVNLQPPFGLQKRIIAALPVENRHGHDRKRIWAGIAAATIVALATWTLARSAFVIRVPSEHTTLMRPAKPPKLTEIHEAALQKLDQRPAEQKCTTRASKALPPASLPQRRAIRIAPLEIQPVVLQPIEIASVFPDISNRKGKTR